MSDKQGKKSDDFDRRLEALSSKLEAREKEKKVEEDEHGLKDSAGMAYGLKLASEFVSAIVVASAIGWFLDQWLGSTPFGLIGFLLLGFAAGVLNVMRATGQTK